MRLTGIISLLVLAGCGQPHVNVRGDSPEPYLLSKCTRDYMEELNRQGKLPRCMIVDANESTNVMLKLEERRKLEDDSH
jgi:hypothetical protein